MRNLISWIKKDCWTKLHFFCIWTCLRGLFTIFRFWYYSKILNRNFGRNRFYGMHLYRNFCYGSVKNFSQNRHRYRNLPFTIRHTKLEKKKQDSKIVYVFNFKGDNSRANLIYWKYFCYPLEIFHNPSQVCDMLVGKQCFTFK